MKTKKLINALTVIVALLVVLSFVVSVFNVTKNYIDKVNAENLARSDFTLTFDGVEVEDELLIVSDTVELSFSSALAYEGCTVDIVPNDKVDFEFVAGSEHFLYSNISSCANAFDISISDAGITILIAKNLDIALGELTQCNVVSMPSAITNTSQVYKVVILNAKNEVVKTFTMNDPQVCVSIVQLDKESVLYG